MKKVVFFIVIIISLIAIKELVHSIVTLWQKQNLIVQTQQELEKVREENKKLKASVAKTQKPSFIEEEARNKLFLVRGSEQQVLIPPTLIPKDEEYNNTSQEKQPVWQQWYGLFF